VSRPYPDAVLAQPENLARSAAVVRSALAAGAFHPALGTGRVAALGMGASAAAAAGFAAVLRGAGRAASTVHPTEACDGLADGYLAISQSGRSRETVEALAALAPGRRVALTQGPDRPLGTVADLVLPLGSGEDSRVSTLSYTATVQALGLLAATLTGSPQGGWAALPELASAALALDVESIVDGLDGVSCVDVVGSGARVASALAAALLLREAARVPAAGYTAREYLHGHLEVAGPGHGALVFGTGRAMELAADLAGYGSSVVLVTAAGAVPARANLRVLRLPTRADLPELGGCALDLLPVQLVAYRLAERRGLLPIELRHMPADTKLSG
jgi:glucosamine--fructose-6-phosphate aminotransferase (isomerizing)